MKASSFIVISLLCFYGFFSCASTDPKPVKDCKKNCISLYGECVESCKVQQPPRETRARKTETYEYHNRVMMSNCADRCDKIKKKCYSDCESYRMFENNGAPEK